MGFLKRCWSALRRPSTAYASGTLLLLGAVFGAVGIIGTNEVVSASSTLTFCTSCHEMEAYVYQEYKQSIHYQNPAGVRAICANCHVPHATIPKLIRKMRATVTEVPAHFLGAIDTKEKFDAKRLELAQSVWDEMKANDSRECRSCHSPDTMKLEDQRPRARAQHEDAKTSGETCIDCHKGIAHQLPDMPKEEPAPDEDFSL